MIPLRRPLIISLTLAIGALLASCGNGISDTASNGGFGGDLSKPEIPVGDGIYVAFEDLDFSSADNSVMSVLFRARDFSGAPLDGLGLADLQILEDDEPLDTAESLQTLLPKNALPYTLQTAIVMDVSASIDQQELSQMTSAVRAILSSQGGSGGLLTRQRVALYTFDSSAKRVVGFTDDEEVLGVALDSVTTSGTMSTDLYGALQFVSRDMSFSYTNANIVEGAIILITDGRDTANRVSMAQALSATKDAAVFTVGVGQDADVDALQQLGSEGFASASSFLALNASLDDIQQQLRRWLGSLYSLSYASPKRRAAGSSNASDHYFSLRAIDNSNANKNTAQIRRKFNSYNFSEVSPTVTISGARSINVGQTESYVAETRWSGNSTSQYVWSVSGLGCTLKSSFGATARVVAVQSGECQVLALDTVNASSTKLLVVAEDVRLDP